MSYPAYDFDSRFATVDGQRLHYVDEGKGETILMLHGNPTWSYLYRHLIVGLQGEHRCIAPDHLGFGFSDKPRRGDYTMRAHIMRLTTFAKELDLRDVTVVVQDWGGIIGLGWAIRNKERVKRLVVMNTTGFAPDGPRAGKAMKPIPWGILLLWSLKIPGFGEAVVQGLNGFVNGLLPVGIHNRERLTPDVMEGYRDPYPSWASRKAILKSVRQIPILKRHPTWRLLEEIGAGLDGWNVPTQFIWGMKDPVFVPWFLEEFERRLPNHGPSLRLENASHFLQDDEPQPIVDKISEFMARTHVRATETQSASSTAHS